MRNHIILTGNLFEGYRFFGPFTYEEAKEFHFQLHDGSEGEIEVSIVILESKENIEDAIREFKDATDEIIGDSLF